MTPPRCRRPRRPGHRRRRYGSTFGSPSFPAPCVIDLTLQVVALIVMTFALGATSGLADDLLGMRRRHRRLSGGDGGL